MAEDIGTLVRGRRILVVEDEFFIAEELRHALEEAGAMVVGPVSTVGAALAIVRSPEPLDGATLDMTLGRERSHEVAHALRERCVPFVILSGYGERGLPEELRNVPRCEKPFDIRKVVKALYP
jgi:DNA-binding response OmpR family regulator